MTTPLPLTAIAMPESYRKEEELYTLYSYLRKNNPIPYVNHPSYEPFRAVTRHNDIKEIEIRSDEFIAGKRATLLSKEAEKKNLEQFGHRNGVRALVHMDGDEHRAYRNITRDVFMPKGLQIWKQQVASIAKQYVDKMAESGSECDFVEDVAFWFPLRIAMTILGVPPEDEEFILRTTQQLSESDAPDDTGTSTSFADALEKFYGYFSAMVEERRKNPTSDAGSKIANGTINGEPLGVMETISYFMLVATAGHDTTSSSIAGGMKALIENPDQLQLLSNNLDLLDTTAVDEIVRWVSPVKHFMRTALVDTEVGGIRIHEGDCLKLLFASANRDEENFESPNTFNLLRKERHLGFGFGPHLCLGQHLARMEIQAFFRELLPRLSHIEITGEPLFTETLLVGGLKYLPVSFRIK